MSDTEGTGLLGIVLLIGAIVFSLGWAAFLAFTTIFFYLPDLEAKPKSDSDKDVMSAHRKTLRAVRRRWMLTYAWSAHLLLAITYWAMWVEQGNVKRGPGERKVNYSRFIGEAAASFALALNLAIFFWFENHLFVNLGYGAMTASAFVFLLLGTLESNSTQRILYTVLSILAFVGALLWTGIAGQMRLIAVAKKEGRRGRPVPLMVGWIVLGLVALCYFGYWLFWLLGRDDQNLSGLKSRWQIELPWLIIDLVYYVIVPIVTYLFYHPHESHFVDSLRDGRESSWIVRGTKRVRRAYNNVLPPGQTQDDAIQAELVDEVDV